MSDSFDPRSVYLLENRVQPYAWGSTTAIPELLGRQNAEGTPEAELWMGAHPKAPSTIRIGDRVALLDSLIESYPEDIIGRQTVRSHG
ncbi:MAG TPA: type I phosphomannose isomerase catalytic subunit, partial [Spirochaetia bacterium]|nr:type I phosphomannose isomerase catalytic subunit [Spirochaetia bacterium]